MPRRWGPLFALDPEQPGKTLPVYVRDDDLRDVVDGPPYQLFELQRLVPEVIGKRCVAVFEGLRRQGSMTLGRAYTGRPSRAVTNQGDSIVTRPGMCYVVFVSADGMVYDWDWVPEGSPGVPREWEKRFARQLWPERRGVRS